MPLLAKTKNDWPMTRGRSVTGAFTLFDFRGGTRRRVNTKLAISSAFAKGHFYVTVPVLCRATISKGSISVCDTNVARPQCKQSGWY